MLLTFTVVNIYFYMGIHFPNRHGNYFCVNTQGIYVQFVLINLIIYKIVDVFFCRGANTTQLVIAFKYVQDEIHSIWTDLFSKQF